MISFPDHMVTEHGVQGSNREFEPLIEATLQEIKAVLEFRRPLKLPPATKDVFDLLRDAFHKR